MAQFLVTDLKIIDSPQAGIGVARCLKAAGHKVYGGDDTPFVTSSSLFEKTFVIEEIRTLNLDSLIKKLISYRNLYDIEYIIPCYDETAILFSFIKDKLEFLGIKLIAPTIESIKKIRKSNLHEIATKSLNTPRTKRVKSLEEAVRVAEQLNYPVYVKGLTKIAMLAENRKEVIAHVTNISSIWNNSEIDCLIQESIAGKNINALIAYRSSKIVAYLEMEKIGKDPNGATWFGKMTDGKLLFSKAKEILKKVNLNDCIIEIEAIQDRDNFYIYEINPRPPAWIYASCLNGINFFETFLNPSNNVVFNEKEVYFGRETTDFIKDLPASFDSSDLSLYSKGAAYKTSQQQYPSDLIL